MRRAGAWALCGAVFAAPLLVGSSRRPALLALCAVLCAALLTYLAGLRKEGGTLRVSTSALLPAALVLICALQIVPLPIAWRNALDPAGGDILANAREAIATHALSLDPPSTARELGKAAMLLAVFLLSYHMASGRRTPHRLIRVVAVSGVTALVIGLGHVAIGEPRVFGAFPTMARLLVVGPFLNPNHTAELLELAAFASLALASLGRSPQARWWWLAGTVVLAAGAVATLSRASIPSLAVGALVFLFLHLRAKEGSGDQPDRSRGRAMLGSLLTVVVAAVVLAAALGAGALIDEISRTDLTREVKPLLWSDALSVVRAHPLGVGRGAFQYVYPVYQNLEPTAVAPSPVRYDFVENGPLQLLIDTGWLGIALLILAAAMVIRDLVRGSRIGRVEAALLGGMAAVLAHNLVDFGLELPGVAIPFCAVLGTTLGRPRPDGARSFGVAAVLPAAAALGLVAGIGFLGLRSSQDFDQALRDASGTVERLSIAQTAQDAHPADYFYVFAQARSERLTPDEAGRSPRLAALNRALRLCPNCTSVNMDVANALWDLSLHSQSLAQWRQTLRRAPAMMTTALDELRRRKATSEELALLDMPDDRVRVPLVRELTRRGAPALARQLIGTDGDSDEYQSAKCEAELADGDTTAAAATVSAWQARRPRSALLHAAKAELLRRAGRPDDAALELAAGLSLNPANMDLARRRIQLAIDMRKWTDAKRAIEDLRRMLHEADAGGVEEHVWEARVALAMDRPAEAIGHLASAAAQESNNVWLHLELGRASERTGRVDSAVQAFNRVLEIEPGNSEAKAAIERLAAERRKATTALPELLAP